MEDLAVFSVDPSSAAIATSSPASSPSTPETTSLFWNKSKHGSEIRVETFQAGFMLYTDPNWIAGSGGTEG